MPPKNKRKIINDAVYGFISIPDGVIFDIIEHPYFQRLRRIKQLSLTHLVYPGALHTRFQHVIGAMSLMEKALFSLRSKGVEITKEEEKAVLIAILLHDIGHGPFSHTLEHSIIQGVAHEEISLLFMRYFEGVFGKDLSEAIAIFSGNHSKPFLHQLVSSQLDMDRMDYLNRDSYFTGVSEGKIGSDRIIDMLHVHQGNLVVEEKGIYTVEKFITSRRLMYWQVYLHKTVIAAEWMLIKALKRAKELELNGEKLFASPALNYFLKNKITKTHFEQDTHNLELFSRLDDIDIMSAVKVWCDHSDKVLSILSKGIIHRNLLKVEIAKMPFTPTVIAEMKKNMQKKYQLSNDEVEYFVFSDKLTNNAYNSEKENIQLLMKNGEIVSLPEASDNLNISALAKPVTKYALFYPSNELIN